MNKEELYKLALSDVHKYSLLNEIFAIRDERFPNKQQESMLYVNGYIGLDVLNDYVDLQQRIAKAIEYSKQIIKDTKSFYRPTSDTIYSGDCLIDIAEQNIEILGGKK